MTKLNQVIAVEKGVKSRVYSHVSELNKALQKSELFNGFSKQYQTLADEGETLPPENKRVQFTATDFMRDLRRSLTEMMDITAQKDWTNCVAKADVRIDDAIIIADAPVSFLLFLEKQLLDVRAFVGNLPTLDDSENWKKDDNSGLFKTENVQTHRTKKVQKAIVLYDATEHHPAQTALITEDILAGYWNQVKQSGAIPKPDRQAMLERTETFLRAVKEAREAANIFDVVKTPEVGDAVFGYILGGAK